MTNLHILSEDDEETNSSSSCQMEHQAVRTIRQLPLDTQNYLLELYWNNYNTVIEVVPQEAFLEGYKRGSGEYYSVFLHIVILAMGIRFADKSRPDIGLLMTSTYESILLTTARQLIELALEGGGLSAIQGFLLLADLECGCGRDVVGWMYSGIPQIEPPAPKASLY